MVLVHSGIKGMHWGVRNGPPYPLKGSQLSPSEKRHKEYNEKHGENKKYNSTHIDKTLSKGTKMQTMSFDKDRTKNSEFVYASYGDRDRLFYEAYFNKQRFSEEKDENGEPIGYSKCCMYKITNELANDTRVASGDTCEKLFTNLVENSRDFSNFIKDPNRFGKLVDAQGVSDTYGGAIKKLHDFQKTDNNSEDDVAKIYKVFGYCLPVSVDSDRLEGLTSKETAELVKDFARQRARFFKACKQEGYGAIVDWNNAIRSGMGRRTSAAIIIDPTVLIPKDISETTIKELKQSRKEYSHKYNPFANIIYADSIKKVVD